VTRVSVRSCGSAPMNAVDESLQHHAEQPAHHLAAVGALHHLGQLEQGRLIQGHRVSPSL
jgi:hypothetical protein